jgi:3-oxo-5-alpha-steroid 4-dehydrogenase 1
MTVNIHSDHVLRNLRKPGETGYKIPRGGLFTFVSAPNLLGEVTEWIGFAVASWSWPAVAFALLTASNLIPRALQHHEWYTNKFGDEYPSRRRAVIPFVL